MKELIQFRRTLWELIQLAQLLGASRELSLAVTTLQSGRMRLGSVALELGSENPYPQADNPASPEIRPTADVPEIPTDWAKILAAGADAGGPVANVKFARVAVQDLINDMALYRRTKWARSYGSLGEVIYDLALADMIQAKQWLGEQLAVLNGKPVVKPAARAGVRPSVAALTAERASGLVGKRILFRLAGGDSLFDSRLKELSPSGNNALFLPEYIEGSYSGWVARETIVVVEELPEAATPVVKPAARGAVRPEVIPPGTPLVIKENLSTDFGTVEITRGNPAVFSDAPSLPHLSLGAPRVVSMAEVAQDEAGEEAADREAEGRLAPAAALEAGVVKVLGDAEQSGTAPVITPELVTLAAATVDDTIRTHLEANSPVTEICRVLNVTEHRVNKIKKALAREKAAAPAAQPATT